MENEAISIWNKKYSDLTVGDNMKIIGAATAVTVGVMGVICVMGVVADRIQWRKWKQNQAITPVEGE